MKTILPFLVLLLAGCSTVFGLQISYKYDGAGRLVGAAYSGTGAATYDYDKNGNLLASVIAGNVLLPPLGSYDGIIDDAASPGNATEGLFSVSVSISGAFTGKLRIGGATYSFKGQFD